MKFATRKAKAGWGTAALVLLAAVLVWTGPAEAGRKNAPKITAVFAANGDLKREVWRTACASMAIGCRMRVSVDWSRPEPSRKPRWTVGDVSWAGKFGSGSTTTAANSGAKPLNAPEFAGGALLFLAPI